MLHDVIQQRARLTQAETQTKIFLRWLLARHNMKALYYVGPFGSRGLYWFKRQEFGPVDNSIRDEMLARRLHYQKEIAAADDRLRSLQRQFPQVEHSSCCMVRGLCTAMVIVAELGDVRRFHRAK